MNKIKRTDYLTPIADYRMSITEAKRRSRPSGTEHLKRLLIFAVLLIPFINVVAQEDQASLMLDLKKARASYEIAKVKYENDERLFANKAISESEFNQSGNELLSREVDYQKLILKIISEQSYVIIEKAIKYQNKSGERRIKVVLRSTMEGNQEYLDNFEEQSDVFTPDMRAGKIYNVFVSLESLSDKVTIGSPYKIKIPAIELGQTAEADFKLLKDVESVQVSLKYGSNSDQMNVLLEKDASANVVDIVSSQFSQETDLGSSATYGLSLERFSTSDEAYQLITLNLPRQISTEFIDPESNARLSQLKFNQGVNVRNLSLKAYLPDREDEKIAIDKPIEFYAVVLSRDEYDKIITDRDRIFSEKELNAIQGGKVKLELIPNGVGKIEVQAPSLYHEIITGDSVNMRVTVRNAGTRRLDNIKISTDNPLNWNSLINPDIINSLDPGREEIINISIVPPPDVNVGAQEVKIKTQAMADNKNVQTEDKTVRIQIEAKTPVIWTVFLILFLLGIIVGVVVFGIKISKR